MAMKNRKRGGVVLMAAICLLSLVQSASAVGKIDGNSNMVAEPVNYTVVCLPTNYQTDPVSQDTLRGFSSDPTMVAVRSQSKYITYTPESPVFKTSYSKLMPSVAEGKPAVLVMHGDEKLYCQYGATAQQISREMRSSDVVNKMAVGRTNCPNCHPRKPKPEPEVKPEPITPTVIEPTQPIAPVAPPQSDADAGKAVAILVVAGACVWALFFRARM